MDRERSIEYMRPRSYWIARRNFSERYQKLNPVPESYSFGNKVTRGNFASLLIDSFTKARDQMPLHHAYLEWLRVNTRFDYVRTIENYEDADGWECLTSSEQTAIENAFTRVRVPQHHDPERSTIPLWWRFDGQIKDLRKIGTGEFSDHEYYSPIPAEQLHGMSRHDILRRLDEVYRSYFEED